MPLTSLFKHAIYVCALCLCSALPAFAASSKQQSEAPDFEKIKAETTNPASKYYYPKLLKEFMKNDTVMTFEDYRYFYYGTIFQEDYDPYRKPSNEEMRREVTPLYAKAEHSRIEREKMQRYAQEAILDNPVDLMQLKNLVFVYEKNQKVNLAKIWKNKLNHLLEVIGSSGTGLDKESAWYIVFPRHEFDFLNITGITVEGTEFEEPYYEKVNVHAKTDKDTPAYYFNLKPVLDQYYAKHPSER